MDNKNLFTRWKSLSQPKKILTVAVPVVVIAAVIVVIILMNSGIRSTSMRLLRMEGIVKLEDANGVEKSLIDNMRFASGDAISTGAASLASIALDDHKIVTLDENSRAQFIQDGNMMELNLTDGGVFFEVNKPLEEDETFDIVNRNDGSYLDPSATYNTQIETSTDQPDAGWKLQSAATAGLYIIVSGSAQLNQTNNGGTNGNMLYNWGSGSNTGDAGCQFAINEVNELSSTALEELEGLQISVSPAAADNLETGQWYVMFDRGANHGYLYENVSSHTLYNTNTAPSGTAVDNAKYLVRLEDATGDGYYYLQDGYGNYFWDLKHGTAVATTVYAPSRIKVAKIKDTDGHFYLQCANNSVVLDANTTYYGDATVVGYKTTVPTATGGNNDWAFYPVTLQRPVILNVVGDKSYATFYYDTDVHTDGTTKAYYIESATSSQRWP